jgi:hypothetical protein
MTGPELAELRYYMTLIRVRKETEQVKCFGKHQFESRAQALATISPRLRGLVHAFHCPKCKGWHIGGQENVNGQRKAMRVIIHSKRGRACE